MTTRRNPRVFLAPGLVLILVAIGGRYTLDRAGLPGLAGVDLRVLGLAGALVLLVVDVTRRPRPAAGPRREGWLIAAGLFFTFQIASGLWAPPGARTGPQALDLALMTALVVAFYLYAAGDPETAGRTTFLLFYWAAVVFAVAALAVTGPGEQGRYAAFGGGPNVFVRIELLGVLSAAALVLLTGRRWPLLGVPLFLLAAALSGSRAGLLAGFVVGAAGLWRIRRRLRTAAVAGAGFTLAVSAAVFGALAPPAFTGLFQERFVEQTVQERYLSGRTDIWAAAGQLAADHPLAGAGLDGFYGLVGAGTNVEYPHNYVLGVAAEGGLTGIGLLTTAVLLWAGTVRGGGARPQLTGLAAAAAFVALSSLFSGDYYDARLAWLFAALAAAAAVTPALGSPAPGSPAPATPAPGSPASGSPADRPAADRERV